MGGSSREREISFAGGRTVFDNLDRSLFTPIPIFIDAFHTLVKLAWKNLYKGTIRDFFPVPSLLPPSPFPIPLYIEQIEPLTSEDYQRHLREIGEPLTLEEIGKEIDFAFLTLHGPYGEDGTIQGALEWLKIPYSGTGIFGSAFGIDKIKQRHLLELAGFATPPYRTYSITSLIEETEAVVAEVQTTIGFPCVVKNPVQGSSIGVHVARDEKELMTAIQKAAFFLPFQLEQWHRWNEQEKWQWLAEVSNLQKGVGFPLQVSFSEKTLLIKDPKQLYTCFNQWKAGKAILLALDHPQQILIERYIAGDEFSAIVMEAPNGEVVCLPPTRIVKEEFVYDYDSKYLPGFVRKETPIRLPDAQLQLLMDSAIHLFKTFHFNVYARIDGILEHETGKIYFNDPNTTSGMLPGSFFFHQASEVGIDPKSLLTYIIYKSMDRFPIQQSRQSLQIALQQTKFQPKKARIGVFLGGYSSERHISVESGRNVYQKLVSSGEYEVIPIFVLKNAYLDRKKRDELSEEEKQRGYSFWEIPIHLLLKENADDIAESIVNPKPVQAVWQKVQEDFAPIRELLNREMVREARRIPFSDLPNRIDFAFIALHGRPGEDGDMQSLFDQLRIPYNGSDTHVARLTLDKYQTGEFLRRHGFVVPREKLLTKEEYEKDPHAFLTTIEQTFPYPFVIKPNDEGCSTGVKIIHYQTELRDYLQVAFRDTEGIPRDLYPIVRTYDLRLLPPLEEILIQEWIRPRENERLVEITVGVITKFTEDWKLEYEVFIPSETVAGKSILSLEEKFLAGEGQNITPARFHTDPAINQFYIQKVQEQIQQIAKTLELYGYARIDAFVRIPSDTKQDPVVIFIEVNTLPGLTPATVLFHQAAEAGYTPLHFLLHIIQMGFQKHRIALEK